MPDMEVFGKDGPSIQATRNTMVLVGTNYWLFNALRSLPPNDSRDRLLLIDEFDKFFTNEYSDFRYTHQYRLLRQIGQVRQIVAFTSTLREQSPSVQASSCHLQHRQIAIYQKHHWNILKRGLLGVCISSITARQDTHEAGICAFLQILRAHPSDSLQWRSPRGDRATVERVHVLDRACIWQPAGHDTDQWPDRRQGQTKHRYHPSFLLHVGIFPNFEEDEIL
jgi:hypothetical protein